MPPLVSKTTHFAVDALFTLIAVIALTGSIGVVVYVATKALGLNY